MRKIAANGRTNKEFNELTKNSNIPNIPSNKLNRETISRIETFLKNRNGTLLQNEGLIFNDNIMGTYQCKFKRKMLVK
jgi:hypothetical protein